MPAYYTAIILNPILKMQWFKEKWNNYKVKKD